MEEILEEEKDPIITATLDENKFMNTLWLELKDSLHFISDSQIKEILKNIENSSEKYNVNLIINEENVLKTINKNFIKVTANENETFYTFPTYKEDLKFFLHYYDNSIEIPKRDLLKWYELCTKSYKYERSNKENSLIMHGITTSLHSFKTPYEQMITSLKKTNNKLKKDIELQLREIEKIENRGKSATLISKQDIDKKKILNKISAEIDESKLRSNARKTSLNNAILKACKQVGEIMNEFSAELNGKIENKRKEILNETKPHKTRIQSTKVEISKNEKMIDFINILNLSKKKYRIENRLLIRKEKNSDKIK